MPSYSLPSVTQSLFCNPPSRLFALLWNIPGLFLDENRLQYSTKAFYDWATKGIPVTRPCEQGNWDTLMVLDPWNQV